MQSQENHLNILIVEDNPGDFYLIERMLRSSKVRVKDIYPASRISEAITLLQSHKVDLVLLDLSLPDGFGIDSFLQIKPFVQNTPVIILTGLSESKVAFEALKQGAQDYLVKGEFQADLLSRSILYSIERKNAEEKIILSEEKYKQIFYKNPFPAWIYDPENWQILEVNDAAIRAYGYTRGEFLALTAEDIRQEKEIRMPPHMAVIEGEQGTVTRHKKKNGDIMIVETTTYPVSYSGKTAMQVLVNDITEELRLARELEEQQKQKQRQIAEAILKAQDEERKSLGAELHDNINQILATGKLYLTAGLRDHDMIEDMVLKSQDCIVMAIEEIRKLSKALITPGFISTGLKQAIEAVTAEIRDVKKLEFVTDLDALEDAPLSEILQITIYRIIQEQLNNILKYAEASRVDIRIHTNEENLILIVSDDGKGFDTSLRSKGIGMINIQNRAELFNGKVEVDSSPGHGCRLKVELNLKAELPKKAA